MSTLAGRVALITGATSGIGRAICERLAEEGASVCVVSRHSDRSEAVATGIRAAGGTAMGVGADVRDAAAMRTLVGDCVEQLGGLDILVANAGIGIIGSVAESDPEDWRAMMDINYLGTANIAQAALRPMLEQGRGDIVAIASAGGTKGYPDWSGYCATKWAVVGFMECLAQEVTAKGIRVSTICPGGVDTPFWDNLNQDINRAGSEGRASLMQPADIAETVMLQLRLPRNVLIKRTLLFPTSEWH